MAQVSYDTAYPKLRFLPRSRNWWAWLKGMPPECIHLRGKTEWMATLLPDTLYLRGKSAVRRDPVRPEVSLCRDCLTGVIMAELEEYQGRVLAFEPNPEIFTQYFFVATPDFDAAGLAPEVAAAIKRRLAGEIGACAARCTEPATWLWLSRQQIASLDEAEKIGEAPGEPLCSIHGARKLCGAFEEIPVANLFYMNLPYGEAGAYVWI